ncbi:MAG: hypothetical protein KC621_04690, partial [Myxococcales bacterium]|nr:hypothetical protein [Myxococcales bacterium]
HRHHRLRRQLLPVMEVHVRIVAAALLLTACAEEELSSPAEREPDVIVDGTLPDGVELDDVLDTLDGGGFAIVADPATGAIATVTTDEELARVASAEFSVATSATCPDCGDPTCAVAQRTIRIGLRHDSGSDTEVLQATTIAATNFASPSINPLQFSTVVGDTVMLDTVGTLPTCAPFAWTFDVTSALPPLRTFVTSTVVAGDFGAVGNASAADSICRQVAQAASLGGAWRAWVRDDIDGLPQDRFTSDGPWVRIGDGATVARNLDDLVNDTLQAPILNDESGTAVVGGRAWTGFTTMAFGGTCSNWTSVGTGFLLGGYGLTDRADAAWDQSNQDVCTAQRHLLCFEERLN